MHGDLSAADLLGELRALIARQARGQRSRPVLTGLTVGVAAGPTEPVSGFARPSVTVVAQGVKRTVLNDRIFDYRAGQYLVVSLDLPVTGHVQEASAAEPFAAVSLALDRALIAGLLLEAPAAVPPRVVSGLVISDAAAELLDPVIRLLRLAESPADAAVLGPAVRREIAWRLITGEQGAIIRQIGLAGGPLAQVARAIQWIREHYDEPLRADRLAALAGMSVSSLHRHFRAATSMTPLQYQKQIRLQEARALLLSSPRDVAQVGHLVGYESPSQFSREYRRLFGAPPRRDREAGRLPELPSPLSPA
jgi:AraC-like DNA-binding protein